MITVTDLEVLTELMERALPRLDFRNSDQQMAGDELLRAVNFAGAVLEWQKEDRG